MLIQMYLKKKDKTILSSKWAIYGGRKSISMKEQEAKGLLSSLENKTPLSNIPLLGNILFQQSLSI